MVTLIEQKLCITHEVNHLYNLPMDADSFPYAVEACIMMNHKLRTDNFLQY